MLFADHAWLSATRIILQQCCEVQSSCKCHFLIYGDERSVLVVCFIKCLETFPFRWKQFCRCAINRLSHAFPNTWNIFTNSTLIYLACSFADAMFFSGNFRETSSASFLRTHAEHIRVIESKSAYFCLLRMRNASKSGFGKIQYKKLQPL